MAAEDGHPRVTHPSTNRARCSNFVVTRNAVAASFLRHVFLVAYTMRSAQTNHVTYRYFSLITGSKTCKSASSFKHVFNLI